MLTLSNARYSTWPLTERTLKVVVFPFTFFTFCRHLHRLLPAPEELLAEPCRIHRVLAGDSTHVNPSTVTTGAGAQSHRQQTRPHRAGSRGNVHLHGLCSTPEESSGLHSLRPHLLLWLPHEGQGQWGACVPRVQQPACHWLCRKQVPRGFGD